MDGGPSAKEMASAAKERTSAVASSAVGATKEVAHEAGSQMSAVTSEARARLHDVMGQARREVRTQADQRSQQGADALQTFARQLAALAEGRPAEAGHVGTLVGEAQQRVNRYAQRVQQGGPQALMNDVAAFARRHPMRFLFAAGAAGFAMGRLARSAAAANSDGATSDQSPAVGYSYTAVSYGSNAVGSGGIGLGEPMPTMP
jgi:hypothetical protein